MNSSTFLGLLHNVALLLVMCFIYDEAAVRWRGGKPSFRQLITGLILGAITILIMLTPWQFSVGIFFDTRSVLLSISGLFFGTASTLTALFIAAVFRFNQGGAGAWTGVAVIVTSGIIGIVWRHIRREKLADLSWGELYFFGILVHVAMLLCMLSLPSTVALNVLSKISLPVMLIYPVGVALLGKLMSNRLRGERVSNALIEREERYRSLFENNHAVMLIIDPDGGGIIDANPAAAAFYGWTLDDLRQRTISEINIMSPSEVRSEMDRALTEGRKYFFFQHCLADGSVRDVEVYSGPISLEGRSLLYSIIHDVSEQKRAERKVLEQAQYLRTVLQTTQDGFWIVNTRGKFTEVNEAYCAISGYSRNEFLRLSIPDIDADEKPDETASRIDRIIQKGSETFEARHRRKDGSIFDVEVSASYLNIEGGQFVFFCRDITERKRAEQEKEKLQTQLVQARKMEAVGTLAGGVAHDFNNLLQAISGYTQIMLMDKEEDDPDCQNLKAIFNAGERAAQLVRQLLLFSRKAETEKKSLDLNHELEQARRLLERTIPKMIDIKLHPGSRLGAIKADPVQIEQVLLNLGTNAADAMPDGGKFVIETENITLNHEYARNHVGATPGNYVLLTVSDTGQGMDQETVQHIFEPFFTTKEIGKGTGLGLASVYGIVKGHGGYITCYSEPGQGTTFKIYLPVIEQKETTSDRSLEGQLPTGGKETILLADDEETIRDFASKALKRFGYAVIAVTSGEEALEAFIAQGDKIDLVILDIGMPGMGGHRCLGEILRIDRSAKVIIASGYAINGMVKKSLEAGAAGYIGKPYQVNALLNKVRAVLDVKE